MKTFVSKSMVRLLAVSTTALATVLFSGIATVKAGSLIDNGGCRSTAEGGAICSQTNVPMAKKGAILTCDASGGSKMPTGCLVYLGPEKLGIEIKPGKASDPLPHDGRLYLKCTGALDTNCSITVSPGGNSGRH